ncbi:hypothetical protein CDL12_15999 [Handroanthus impetiginosus]|uniref:CCHC-type domain-containing protein n=1 Tax=Handroanthus impetiginosus TaxID=429701 RepID=A0A2G9H1M8_9LAMI|nr:hypothetical protein CDL12_15999 [Handroanthus impetiginosus]
MKRKFSKEKLKVSKREKTKKKKIVICCRCSQVGHYVNRCKVKNKIESLDLDEGLKKSLCKILLNEKREDIFGNIVSKNSNSGSKNESSNFTKNKLEESPLEKKNVMTFANTRNVTLNVLTKEESFILDLIDQISDPIKKRKALEKYLQEKPNSFKLAEKTFDKEPYSLQKIMAKVYEISKREPTISELKTEIN